eukprot:1160510-Pelagomonas_calceolata.AAC.2
MAYESGFCQPYTCVGLFAICGHACRQRQCTEAHAQGGLALLPRGPASNMMQPDTVRSSAARAATVGHSDEQRSKDADMCVSNILQMSTMCGVSEHSDAVGHSDEQRSKDADRASWDRMGWTYYCAVLLHVHLMVVEIDLCGCGRERVSGASRPACKMDREPEPFQE